MLCSDCACVCVNYLWKDKEETIVKYDCLQRGELGA